MSQVQLPRDSQHLDQAHRSVSCFCRLDLDFMCAVRTPPHNSWKNPAERIMLILNLALQGVGIARAITTLEDQLQKCIVSQMHMSDGGLDHHPYAVQAVAVWKSSEFLKFV